jgi:Ribbon-helix-helix protein, copG family
MLEPDLSQNESSTVTAFTVQLEDDMAEALRRLAATQQRSETDVLRDALAVYVQTVRPLPKGMGKYHSGQNNVSVAFVATSSNRFDPSANGSLASPA